jgi:hypothetical protein
MKKLVTKGFVTAGLLLMMIVAGVSAQAQSLQYRLTANIPFDLFQLEEVIRRFLRDDHVVNVRFFQVVWRLLK